MYLPCCISVTRSYDSRGLRNNSGARCSQEWSTVYYALYAMLAKVALCCPRSLCRDFKSTQGISVSGRHLQPPYLRCVVFSDARDSYAYGARLSASSSSDRRVWLSAGILLKVELGTTKLRIIHQYIQCLHCGRDVSEFHQRHPVVAQSEFHD